jgi:hypothetical protein
VAEESEREEKNLFFLFFLVLFAVSGNMVSLCYQLEGGEEEGK